jgi:hypothetical protein
MNTRLYKDDSIESLTDEGKVWSELVRNHIETLVGKAVIEGVSLRDLTTVVCEEIAMSAIERRIDILNPKIPTIVE